jgi:hypothetical protein
MKFSQAVFSLENSQQRFSMHSIPLSIRANNNVPNGEGKVLTFTDCAKHFKCPTAFLKNYRRPPNKIM